jgi:4'-phosphopantetheinyl transferase EntD
VLRGVGADVGRNAVVVVVDVPDHRASTFAADLAERLSLLPAAEQALCSSWAPRRQATFAAGRAALREAFVQAGVVHAVDDVGPVGRDDRGAPVLPPLPQVVRTSLTHKDTIAAALVDIGDVPVATTMGLDLELDDARDRRSTDKLAAQVLLPDELAALDDDDDRRRRQLFERFSLKEALYKGLDPFVRRYVGFLEVGVVVDEQRARFTLPPKEHAQFAALGGVLDVAIPDVVLTWACVQRADG